MLNFILSILFIIAFIVLVIFIVKLILETKKQKVFSIQDLIDEREKIKKH